MNENFTDVEKPTKFARKYRVHSSRLQNWDYTSPGMYFLTICTYERNDWFGKISGGQMVLSEAGKIADACWQQIPLHFPHVHNDAFVVMPDHLHGIIVIDRRPDVVEKRPVVAGERPVVVDGCPVVVDERPVVVETSDSDVSTTTGGSTTAESSVITRCSVKTARYTTKLVGYDNNISRKPGTETQSRIPPKRPTPGSISSIMNQYKSACTKAIRAMGISDFRWQSRFHDEILTNSNDLKRIRGYIRTNPQRWKPSIDPFCLPL